jgi:hypothetical protein
MTIGFTTIPSQGYLLLGIRYRLDALFDHIHGCAIWGSGHFLQEFQFWVGSTQRMSVNYHIRLTDMQTKNVGFYIAYTTVYVYSLSTI